MGREFNRKMTSNEELVKDFFRNAHSNCSKICISINMLEIIEKFPIEKKDLLNYIWAFSQFLQKNLGILDQNTSYFRTTKLFLINPLLPDADLKRVLKELNCHYTNDRILVFEEEDESFLLLTLEEDKLIINVYYFIENTLIRFLKNDLTKIQGISNFICAEYLKSGDLHYNTILYYLLVKKYKYLFTKQDLETKDLLLEISAIFFEAFAENRKYKLIACMGLISMIIENNLIRLYLQSENKRPNEGYNINLLNNIIAKKEIITLRHNSGNNYILISRSGNIKNKKDKLYNRDSRIYMFIKDYADTIRNKVFHFQQSISLDLYHTSVHAMKYLVNILMEIEDNERL